MIRPSAKKKSVIAFQWPFYFTLGAGFFLHPPILIAFSLLLPIYYTPQEAALLFSSPEKNPHSFGLWEFAS